MFSAASLHPVAYFAILAAIFSYLYAQHRQHHFLLWALGWALLAVRQVALAAAPQGSAGGRLIDAFLLIAGGLLILLAAVAFGGPERLGFRRAALYGLALGTIAALVLTTLTAVAPALGVQRAASLGILAACWAGTGWLVYRYGRTEAPNGARLAGLSLFGWGVWVPVGAVLGIRLRGSDWPAEVDAALGALVAVGMVILGIEESRARIARRADPRLLLDDESTMVAIVRDGRVLYANRSLRERVGLPLERLLEGDVLDLVAPGHRVEAARRLLRNERAGDFEIDMIDAEGLPLPVSARADVVVWEDHPALRFELIDITPRRMAEQQIQHANAELRRMNEELERANRLQSEFLSNTTHELKTPLTSIMANTEILEYEMCGPVNEEQRRVLANISRNSQHLLEMISRLLDFARQREGAEVLRREEVRIREILEGVAETVRPLLEEKHLALEIQIDPDLDTCWLDGEKIYRVYLNLVENAIKFSTRGTILVRAGMSDGEFEGSVVDEGIGIPPDRLEEIFRAFTQVDASSTRTYPGVGLGLAICKQLVEMHGGRIWAESRPRQGSVFRFRIPCPPLNEITPPAPPSAPEPGQPEGAPA